MVANGTHCVPAPPESLHLDRRAPSTSRLPKPWPPMGAPIVVGGALSRGWRFRASHGAMVVAMSQMERVYEIDRLLRNRRTVTMQRLIDELRVSRATVDRKSTRLNSSHLG